MIVNLRIRLSKVEECNVKKISDTQVNGMYH